MRRQIEKLNKKKGEYIETKLKGDKVFYHEIKWMEKVYQNHNELLEDEKRLLISEKWNNVMMDDLLNLVHTDEQNNRNGNVNQQRNTITYEKVEKK